MPNPRASLPKRDQIAAALKQQMFDGQLRDGTRLKSVRDLAAEWDVGHVTVQAALEQLRTEGLIHTEPDVGSFATNTGRALWGPQQQIQAPRFPRGQRIEVTDAALIHAPRYVAGMLGSDMVVRRQEITHGPNGPIALTVSWCPGWALTDVPDLGNLRPLENHTGGAAFTIAATIGQPVTWGWAAIESRFPRDDGREQPLLHLTAGVPVLAHVYRWDTGTGENRRTLEYREIVNGANQVLEFEILP